MGPVGSGALGRGEGRGPAGVDGEDAEGRVRGGGPELSSRARPMGGEGPQAGFKPVQSRIRFTPGGGVSLWV